MVCITTIRYSCITVRAAIIIIVSCYCMAFLYCSQAVESGILLLRDLDHPGLPLLNNTTAVDTDSTDASTTQSPITQHDSRGNLSRKPHKYESIDDFSKPDGRHNSSSVSRDASPPMARQQPASTGTVLGSRRIR